MEKGYVHLYTGDGKGKTTAAAGLCARAAGCGLRVGFFQFMKDGVSGEVISLAKLGVTVVSPQGGGKFIWQMDEAELAEYAEKQRQTLARAGEMMGRFDVLALDELACCVDAGLIPFETVAALVQGRPEGLELVLTGRCRSEALRDLADYVTEMRMVKHPYEQDVPARRGIEF